MNLRVLYFKREREDLNLRWTSKLFQIKSKNSFLKVMQISTALKIKKWNPDSFIKVEPKKMKEVSYWTIIVFTFIKLNIA